MTTAEVLSCLSGTTLDLSGTNCNDADLRHAQTSFSDVTSLSISAYISITGLNAVAPSLPKITSLDLDMCCGVTDALLDELVKAFPKLTSLSILGSKVTDVGVAHLARLSGLTELHLDWVEITDEGLKLLAVFSELTSLSLECNKITDAGLRELLALPKLAELFLTDNEVTKDGVAQFRASRPNCKVECDNYRIP